MIIARGLVVLSLALGTAAGESPFGAAGAGAAASSSPPPPGAARRLAIAAFARRLAAAAASGGGGSSRRRALRRGLRSFADACARAEGDVERSVPGATCQCGTDTLTCQYWKCDGDGFCGNYDITATFSGGALELINACVRPTGGFRDVCVVMNFGSGAIYDSCSIQVEDSAGAVATCATCKVCDASGTSMNIDCSNVLAGATTGGCVPTDSVGSTRGEDQIFDTVNSGGGSGNGGLSTSSGAFHGSSTFLALGGVGLALIM
jgi:hypothetical protein